MTKPASPASKRSNDFYSAASLLAGKDNNIGLLIKQVQSSLNRMIDQHVSPLGLTAMQWRPLVMIRYLDINTPAELSRGAHVDTGAMTRSEERRVGKACVSTCRSRWSPNH